MLDRLRTWLQRLRRQPRAGRLEAVLLAERAGAPMQAVDGTDAIAGQGLAGDRYAVGTGWWRATDGCQVTLIHAEHLERARRKSGLDVTDGRHRRNLVVSGLAGVELRGRQLRIGTALFAWHRIRPPCGYLDQVSGRGTAKALSKRAGICLTVIEGGHLSVHDPVHLLPYKRGQSPF